MKKNGDVVMSGERKNIFDSYIMAEVLSCLKQKIAFPDELITALCSNTMEIVLERKLEEIGEKTKEFCVLMSRYWNAKEYLNEKNTELLFQMGRLDTCARMLDRLISEQDVNDYLAVNAKHFMGRYSFFYSVHMKPGIRHNELAQSMKVSVSCLSQFAAKIQRFGYYDRQLLGREKYYTLTRDGERLFEEMEKIKREETVAESAALISSSKEYSRANSLGLDAQIGQQKRYEDGRQNSKEGYSTEGVLADYLRSRTVNFTKDVEDECTNQSDQLIGA